MTTEMLWERKNLTGDGDLARVSVSDETGNAAILTTDKGSPKVILISRKDLEDLVGILHEYLYKEDDENERSEKDALWEDE